MKVTCRECGKSYDSEMQVLCPHRTEDGRLYYVNMMYVPRSGDRMQPQAAKPDADDPDECRWESEGGNGGLRA